MKYSRETSKFQPITITLETPEEVERFWHLLNAGKRYLIANHKSQLGGVYKYHERIATTDVNTHDLWYFLDEYTDFPGKGDDD